MNILITGAMGYLGSQIVTRLMTERDDCHVIATDIKLEPDFELNDSVTYEQVDVRSSEMQQLFDRYHVDTVIHLATIVTPGKKSDRSFEYSVDVEGTRNVIEACVETNVRRLIVSSSGAAYGYHADNANWITEDEPIRGNKAFAYAYHKRLVEDMLADYRESNPELEQIIFRIGTILGENVDNQITDLFKKPYVLGVKGSKSPFVFIWDQDVVSCFIRAIDSDQIGIYNIAGDGALTIDEIADQLGKNVIRLPASLLKFGLTGLKKLRLTQYGPEQLDFLRYRPVLDNTKLKQDFGFVPSYTSAQVFQEFVVHRNQK
ncbi:SDR family oxidoreductase [Alkalibacillus almallahensis]|uniref:SDR family oxidoreductase n=1 Tax=Alkalibacillus almallahensis TaxID=1379154 RepID=UPI001423A21D|nr:SDR family oxidoreductase [Alkalibacillus almallahensis]NIK12445.1 UDP-glucose 4-epimerase [Alkalibacillus almallahensis]